MYLPRSSSQHSQRNSSRSATSLALPRAAVARSEAGCSVGASPTSHHGCAYERAAHWSARPRCFSCWPAGPRRHRPVAPAAVTAIHAATRSACNATRRLVHLLLGHALVDEARGPMAGAAEPAIRQTTSRPIGCDGSRRRRRRQQGRCRSPIAAHAFCYNYPMTKMSRPRDRVAEAFRRLSEDAQSEHEAVTGAARKPRTAAGDPQRSRWRLARLLARLRCRRRS